MSIPDTNTTRELKMFTEKKEVCKQMSEKLSQREAVFQAITAVLAEHKETFNEGMDISPLMSREYRAEVNSILIEGFKSGVIELGKEFSDSDLRVYVSGLQSNWIRKDTRLNGGVKYVAKNPGSRSKPKEEEQATPAPKPTVILKKAKATTTQPKGLANALQAKFASK